MISKLEIVKATSAQVDEIVEELFLMLEKTEQMQGVCLSDEKFELLFGVAPKFKRLLLEARTRSL